MIRQLYDIKYARGRAVPFALAERICRDDGKRLCSKSEVDTGTCCKEGVLNRYITTPSKDEGFVWTGSTRTYQSIEIRKADSQALNV